MARVLVTGATGLLGSALCPLLAEAGYRVRAAVRSVSDLPSCITEHVVVGDIRTDLDWGPALVGVDLVVHAAARAHVPNDVPENSNLYAAVNAQATRKLAQAAATSGVRRFVYVSSTKVFGDGTGAQRHRSTDLPTPADNYGRSKWQGEVFLQQSAAGSSMETVIVRPPLVYGPGVRANFLRLMQWVDRGYPLPFASVDNRRSLVSVWNLNHLILKLLAHPHAAGVWLVNDGEDLSTPELIRRIARALGRKAHLLPVPPLLLRACGGLTGRSDEFSRLTGSFVIDATPARELLGWSPALSVDEGLARTAAWYRARHPA